MDWTALGHNVWTNHLLPFLVGYVLPTFATAVTALLICLLSEFWSWAKLKVAGIQNEHVRQAVLRLVEAAEQKFSAPSSGTTKYQWVAEKAEELYGVKLDEHEIEAAVYALRRQKAA